MGTLVAMRYPTRLFANLADHTYVQVRGGREGVELLGRQDRRHGAFPMRGDLQYGPRLTDDEYERRIIELHRGLPPMPTADQDRAVRRQELELAIDHRLGRDFPRERREALWAAKERVEKRRLRLGLKFLFKRLFARNVAREAQGLAGYMVDEYAKVLSPAELESFIGLERGQRPVLPIDGEQLKR